MGVMGTHNHFVGCENARVARQLNRGAGQGHARRAAGGESSRKASGQGASGMHIGRRTESASVEEAAKKEEG